MPEPISPSGLQFALLVEQLYASLLATVPEHEQDLGGKLLYAGELTPGGRALLVAGNIAGAASLAVSADPAAGKQAMHDGVADFLVNSLGEALRILKNEIRKHATVSVCVAAPPQSVESEMLVRGVVPDLLPPSAAMAAQYQEPVLSWRVASAPAQWLPRLDAMALDCLAALPPSQAAAARRWLRLAPRYLGRMAQGVRTVRCGPHAARQFMARAQAAVHSGEIAVEVEISLNNGQPAVHLRPHSGPIP